VQSDSTLPFFIICHQSQFESCEGELLKKQAFGDPTTLGSISWTNLANYLQRQFLRVTKQEPNDPKIRSLSPNDLAYFNSKFFGEKQKITPSEFEEFWEWFSKIIHVFRYTRPIVQLWQAGLICPFFQRKNVDEILERVEVGTFLVRFSESYAGQFTISHTQIDDNFKVPNHYLVQPTDTAKNSLPEFIRDKDLLSQVVQLQSFDPVSGSYSFNTVHKNIAFQGFYKQQKPPPPPSEKSANPYQRDPKLLMHPD